MNDTAPAPSEGDGPPRDGSVKRLKQELMAIKERWGKEIKMATPEKGAPGFPYPASVQRKVPCPPSAACWDIEQLVIKLSVLGADKDDLPMKVIAPNPALPKQLRQKIAGSVQSHWQELVMEDDSCWQMMSTLEWVEANYMQLLGCIPELVERYDTGFSELRFTIREAQDESSSEEEEVDPEELARQERLREERLEKKYQKTLEKIAQKEKEDAEARKAAEDGLDSSLEWKEAMREAAELKKAKEDMKGRRQAKTGQKAHKYDGEGSAVEKAKSSGGPLPGSREFIQARKKKMEHKK